MNLILGDCLEKLKELPDNSVDSIVTDPPYGLSFMGKKWDYDVPSIEIWKEALRVLKPGGHLLAFGGTRTYHRLVVNIEDAGFEIRDCIQWLYGSGFPKSHNIKEGNFKGWGTALKPANEPICVARKPLEKGLTVAENVLKWGCGAINIERSRIGSEVRSYSINAAVTSGNFGNGANQPADERDSKTVQGRWPANIILDEVAAEMLDEQSGNIKGSKASGLTPTKARSNMNASIAGINRTGYEDSGGASRFFYVAKASKSERNTGLEGMPKVSKGHLASESGGGGGWSKDSDKNPNLPRENHHPTVKPIKLMKYLIKLVTPPNGVVLDLFMGSGSTGVATKSLGFNFIGIELSQEYFEIAQKRIDFNESSL